jgi:hypothetical protein
LIQGDGPGLNQFVCCLASPSFALGDRLHFGINLK